MSVFKTEHELEIRKYLLTKKLSKSLFCEILDHFVSEVTEKMQKGAVFQDAFLRSKLKWHGELQMVRTDILSFKKVARIEAEIIGSRFRSLIRLSGLAAMVSILFMMIYQPFQVFISVAMLTVFVGLALFLLIEKKLKLSHFIHLNFHPLILRNIIVSILLLFFSGLIAEILFTSQRNLKSIIQAGVLVYNLAIQIQLLYLHQKKINALLS
ncbi:hypothetical protein [Chryseobacterium sp.]|uniref:hypothetical protein n=1 Tax=Chryseobacterium sp. TaxID=1871047 RepID=UPI0011CB23D8|nr:hypothetical protein [Chryseobacterium sp.]TXF77193.1 hypothetical protein FUA25_04445 [Chryseobacterium sp.]